MLETKRTRMIPVKAADYAEVLEMFHEPDTFRYIAPLAGKSDEWYCQFLDSKRKIIEAGKGYYWVVRQKETGIYIGSANLYAFGETDMIQLGCQLKHAYWGQGYASELMARTLTYAITDFGLQEVYGFFDAANIASQRILERLGFSFFKHMPAADRQLEVYRYVASVIQNTP